MPFFNPTASGQFCSEIRLSPGIAPVSTQSLKSVIVPVIPSVVCPMVRVQIDDIHLGNPVERILLKLLVPMSLIKAKLSMSSLGKPL